MANRALNLEDFGAQKLSENQQKIVRGGDGTGNPVTYPIPTSQEGDPGKGGNTGAG